MKFYPSWRYHRTLEPKLVKDEREDAALDPDWADSPAAFENVEASEPEEKAAPRKRGKRVEAVA